MYDSIETTMYDMVHDFPGGAAALAAKSNMNAGTLQHKANPSMETHHMTLKEAVTLMFVTNDFRLLHAVSNALGHHCVSAEPCSGVADIEFLNHFALAMKEVGDMAKAINEAFEDQKITPEEVKAVHRETLEAIAALSKLPARLKGMSDA